MADVKWIKITTDIFDDDKILLIESLPEADSIIVIWFKLLCLAGKQNNSGVFVMGNRIPYTDKMLATIFRRKEATVQLALQTFEQFGMIEIIDGVITIPNWEKHQNLDQLDKIKEQTRQRVAKHREKQKLLSSNVTSNATSGVTETQRNATDKIREEEIRKDKIRKDKIVEEDKREEEKENKEKAFQQIADLYKELCPTLPPLVTLSDSMKEEIQKSLNKYTVEQFKMVFTKASASTFLCGKNERKWVSTFDWLIQDDNMAKVLNGNYDDRNIAYVGRSAAYGKDEDAKPVIVIPEDKEREERMKARIEELKKRVGIG